MLSYWIKYRTCNLKERDQRMCTCHLTWKIIYMHRYELIIKVGSYDVEPNNESYVINQCEC